MEKKGPVARVAMTRPDHSYVVVVPVEDIEPITNPEDHFPSFEEAIAEPAIKDAEAILARLGLRHVNGEILRGDQVLDPWDYDNDSDIGYAWRIIFQVLVVRNSIETGYVDGALKEAFELGMLKRERDLKIAWEAHAQRGVVVQFSAIAGGREFNRQRYDGVATEVRYSSLLSEFEEELARNTKRTAAYAIVAERNNVSPRTVMRAVKAAEEKR